jgi:hypothetical protein
LLDLGEGGSVRAINDTGDIVYTRDTTRGHRAFLISEGRHVALPCYRGHESEASAINNSGHIVGKIWKGRHAHAVKWIKVRASGLLP